MLIRKQKEDPVWDDERFCSLKSRHNINMATLTFQDNLQNLTPFVCFFSVLKDDRHYKGKNDFF